MKKFLTLVCSLGLFSLSHVASAEVESGSFGVGATSTLTGLGGPSITYQADMFHIDGVLGYTTQGDGILNLAGRFWYQINQGDNADFSIGAGLGIFNADDETDVHVELGGKIRMFLTPNVSVSTSVGIGFVSHDGDDPLGLTGDLIGSSAITYFFQ